MSHAFAKDSRACAACISWAGERALSDDHTLVHVERYSVEGECRTASSQDYRKVTKGYHTCTAWSALPMMKKHGGLPERQPPASRPEPALALAGAAPVVAVQAPVQAPVQAMAQTVARPAPVQPAPQPVTVPVPAPAPAAAPEPVICRSDRLELDRIPPAAQILHAYWLRLRQKRGALPRAAEIDTAQLRDGLPRLALLEPVPGSFDFVYRSCGRSLQRRMGLRPAARLVSACHPADAALRLQRDLRACLAEGDAQAFLVRDDPMLPGVRFVDLLLPLADADGRPAMVLAYRHVPGA
ncbi:hypothetical protein [Azospirillum sp. SYSU D00513]|uniref:hypothetical protein n=1 Tax=Azospirillum sp. SYSU D00513 TaxID=2812561 RepID=UPI001A9653E8|nr:hypothetical protein [Azospirillum sp. SYSU D00513]